jgi:hypothetical protein
MKGGEEEVYFEIWKELHGSDEKRFSRLMGWIKVVEREYRPELVRRALVEFRDYERRKGPVHDWYPYLNAILRRVKKEAALSHHMERHNRLKKEENQWLERLRRNPAVAVALLSEDKKLI